MIRTNQQLIDYINITITQVNSRVRLQRICRRVIVNLNDKETCDDIMKKLDALPKEDRAEHLRECLHSMYGSKEHMSVVYTALAVIIRLPLELRQNLVMAVASYLMNMHTDNPENDTLSI